MSVANDVSPKSLGWIKTANVILSIVVFLWLFYLLGSISKNWILHGTQPDIGKLVVAAFALFVLVWRSTWDVVSGKQFRVFVRVFLLANLIPAVLGFLAGWIRA